MKQSIAQREHSLSLNHNMISEKMLKQIEKMTDFFTAGQCREPEKLITELERLTRENHVPRLSDMGIKESVITPNCGCYGQGT